MMGSNDKPQDELFYAFNLDDVVPQDHLLRDIDRLLDFTELREHLAPYYSHTGRPSVDPELPFRSNATAITNQQHADHQLGIDRRAISMAVIRCEMLSKICEIEYPINVAKKMILRDYLVEIERIKQLVLRLVVAAHHRRNAPAINTQQLSHRCNFSRSFSTVSTHCCRSICDSKSAILRSKQ